MITFDMQMETLIKYIIEFVSQHIYIYIYVPIAQKLRMSYTRATRSSRQVSSFCFGIYKDNTRRI